MSRPLRIAFIDYVLEPDKPGRTGLSDIVWDMASALVDLGHEPHVIASYASNSFPDPQVAVHNFNTPPMGYRNIVGNSWLLKRSADITKELKPDILHAPEYISTAVLATLKVDTPLVLTVPGNIYHRIKYGHSYEWHMVQVLKWAAKVSAHRCSAIIAISQEMKRWWELTGSNPETTLWIPLGVDTGRFHPIDEARAMLGIPDDKLIFLYVGRFATEKGLLDLIDAVALLSLEINTKKIEFILIGRGPLEGIIQERIHAHKLENIITIRDWVDQQLLATWYSAADAFVLPSHSEALSRTILEAMSCGTPVIGSAITGTTDHIQDDKNGWLFPARDVNALFDILSKCIKSPQILKTMGLNARNYVEAKLSWKRITQQIVDEVYRKASATQ